MPILVYVIQPEYTFICKDEGDESLGIIHPDLQTLKREGGFMRFTLEKGPAMLVNVENIGIIRYISEEEIDKNKKEAEKQRKEKAQNNIIQPSYKFPTKRRTM